MSLPKWLLRRPKHGENIPFISEFDEIFEICKQDIQKKASGTSSLKSIDRSFTNLCNSRTEGDTTKKPKSNW